MANIKINFNNATKIIPITEKFDTDLRVWYEFANMYLESILSEIPDEYSKTPLIDLPKEILENFFKISEMEKQYDKYEDKMMNRLIRKVEKNFKTKVQRRTFHWVTDNLNQEDIDNDVTHVFYCFDVNLD